MRWFGRLTRSGEIAYVRRAGRRIARPTFTAYVAPARGGRTTIAIAVAKTVGIAVVRNRIRRRIAGALDAMAPGRGEARRLFFVARPSAATASYEDLARDVAAVVAS